MKLNRPFFYNNTFQNIAIVLLFFFIGLCIYSNTYQSPFVLDDRVNIVDYPNIRLTELTFDNIYTTFFKGKCRNRPVANITFAFNYYFHRYNLFGYHLVNNLIHIFNGILLFFLFKHTLVSDSRDEEKNKSTLNSYTMVAFSASLLWLVNPLQTQAVTYIVQRMTSIATLFYILSLLMYVKGRQNTKKTSKYSFFAISFLSALLSFGSKEIAATLPVVIVLYELFFIRNFKINWSKQYLCLALFAIAVIVSISLFFLGNAPMERVLSGYAARDFTLTQRVLTEFRVVVFYLSLLFFPHPSRLNLEHDFPLSYSLINPATTIFSIGFIVAMLVFAICFSKKQRLLSFAILWYLGNLVLESSVIGLEIIFEHRVYLPSAFLCLAVVVIIDEHIRQANIKVAIILILISALSFWTYERNSIWKNQETLWADCTKKAPKKVRPLHAYAYALLQNGKYGDSIVQLNKVLDIEPNHLASHINLGEAFYHLQKYPESIKYFLKAIEFEPENARSTAFLGAAFYNYGNIDKAEEYYKKAIILDPDFSEMYKRLGLIWADQNLWSKASDFFYRAVKTNPNNDEIHFQMANIYKHQKKYDSAIKHYNRAIELNKKNSGAYIGIAQINISKNKLNEAIDQLNKAIEIDPDNPIIQFNLGDIFFRTGNYEEALQHLKKTIHLNPKFANGYIIAGIILSKQNKLEEALNFFKNAIRLEPENALLHNQIANIYFKINEHDNAIKHYNAALSINPSLRKIHISLGRIYEIKGDFEQAVFHYNISK